MLSKFLMPLALAAGLAGAACPVSSSRAAPDVAQEIAHLEDLYSQSFASGDASVAQKLLLEDFIGYEPDTKTSDKASILAEVRAEPRPATITITDLVVRQHGDIAIALGTEEDTMPGSPAKSHRRWLDTWKKTPYGWRLAASAEIEPKP